MLWLLTIVLRNYFTYILRARINRFFSSNSFCAEIEAAIQITFDIDVELKMDKAMLEENALFVILALHVVNQFGDCRDQHVRVSINVPYVKMKIMLRLTNYNNFTNFISMTPFGKLPNNKTGSFKSKTDNIILK